RTVVINSTSVTLLGKCRRQSARDAPRKTLYSHEKCVQARSSVASQANESVEFLIAAHAGTGCCSLGQSRLDSFTPGSPAPGGFRGRHTGCWPDYLHHPILRSRRFTLGGVGGRQLAGIVANRRAFTTWGASSDRDGALA